MTTDQTAILSSTDLRLLRQTIDLSEQSKQAGRHPFAALVADEDGNVIATAGNNSMPPLGDPTQHAELAAVAKAAKLRTPEQLLNCTLYTSAEPCCMCAGAVYWCNIGTPAAWVDRRPSGKSDFFVAVPRGIHARSASHRSAGACTGRGSCTTACGILGLARIASIIGVSGFSLKTALAFCQAWPIACEREMRGPSSTRHPPWLTKVEGGCERSRKIA